jgi:hypothetical protein
VIFSRLGFFHLFAGPARIQPILVQVFMPEKIDPPLPPPVPSDAAAPTTDRIEAARLFLAEYAWFIVRNLIGWLLILASPAVGVLLPGPGGLPIFLIGFALVTFPGKRKLTARVLRGRRLRIEDRAYAILAGFLAIALPGIAIWIVGAKYKQDVNRLIELYAPKKTVFVLGIILSVLVVWLMTRLSLKMLNGLLRLLPKFRRKFRPWLRKKGFNLLPPRRRATAEMPQNADDEILEIDQRHRKRWANTWTVARPWLWRAAAVAITVWIFAIMIRPLVQHWTQVRGEIAILSPWRFIGAAAMFAVFLLCFRALAWRRVLKGFGFKLPYAAATRIWATSELARYLPGAIWQVVGRVYLARPYGVPGAIISTSQILEIFVFLYANVLVAGSCLLWFAAKMDPHARPWLYTALALVPALALLLHPKIFYGIANRILIRIGKPAIVKRLRGRKLVALLAWMILGLLWQSLAVYALVDPVLHLKIDWWWVVAGSYCLAWSAGFLAFWAPGGIGVREIVFVATMQIVIPPGIRDKYFPDAAAFAGLLALVGFLLRLWTIAGEVMLTAVAYAADYKGALNRPNAPGRAPLLNDSPPGGPDALMPASKPAPAAAPSKLKPSSAVSTGPAPSKAVGQS